jgi:putative signal transducing protein
MTSTPSDWTKLASFSTGLEADLAAAALESAGIPSVVLGHQRSGIFGVGFQGKVIGGLELRVPTNKLDEAWEIVASMAPLPSD